MVTHKEKRKSKRIKLKAKCRIWVNIIDLEMDGVNDLENIKIIEKSIRKKSNMKP